MPLMLSAFEGKRVSNCTARARPQVQELRFAWQGLESAPQNHDADGPRRRTPGQNVKRNPSCTNRWKFDCPVELRLIRPKSALPVSVLN
jgi:hypothetical protein